MIGSGKKPMLHFLLFFSGIFINLCKEQKLSCSALGALVQPISFHHHPLSLGPSPVAQLVKNPPAMQETPVQFLDWEDPLKKGTATHSSILVWRIQWTIQSWGSQSPTRLSNFRFSLFPLSGNHHTDPQGWALSNPFTLSWLRLLGAQLIGIRTTYSI